RLDLSCFLCLDGPAPPQIFTLSLHDALPISPNMMPAKVLRSVSWMVSVMPSWERFCWKSWVRALTFSSPVSCSSVSSVPSSTPRSEEHTSELQSRENLVCRLLLEKKKQNLTI